MNQTRSSPVDTAIEVLGAGLAGAGLLLVLDQAVGTRLVSASVCTASAAAGTGVCGTLPVLLAVAGAVALLVGGIVAHQASQY